MNVELMLKEFQMKNQNIQSIDQYIQDFMIKAILIIIQMMKEI